MPLVTHFKATTVHSVAHALAKRLVRKAKKKIINTSMKGVSIRVLSVDEGDVVTLHVFDDAGAGTIIKQLTKSLMDGDSIQVGGTDYWVDASPVMGDGSGCFEWHHDGTRILNMVYVCVRRGGRAKKVPIGPCWRRYE